MMHHFLSARERGLSLRAYGLVLLSLVTCGAWSASGLAQINVVATGLHDGERISGVGAPPTPVPFVNADNILVDAAGATGPALYWNTSFYAYGLFSDVATVNSGSLDVTATGGTAGGGVYTDVVARTYGFGLYARGAVENTNAITVAVHGGTVDANALGDSYAEGFAEAFATGLYSEGAVQNDASIDITLEGGYAGMRGYRVLYSDNYTTVRTDATANGIQASGSVANTGDISVGVTGGTTVTLGTSSDHTIFRAAVTAYGIQAGTGIDNVGGISVAATGGTAETNGTGERYASVQSPALAAGIYSGGAVQNYGDILTAALGGTADSNGYASSYATANAQGYGIYADSDVNNTGGVTGTAAGGYARAYATHERYYPMGEAEANSEVYGIHTSYGDAHNSGDILLTATGGHADGAAVATGSSWIKAEAMARAQGIRAADYAGELVTNAGTITATARGGDAETYIHGYDAEAHASAAALGISAYGDVLNTNDITAAATGGRAHAYGETTDVIWTKAYSWADAYGIDARGDVNNTAGITITATGGDAASSADGGSAYADAHAYASGTGILAREDNVDNTGDIAVHVTGGTAAANGTATTTVSADAVAYGLEAVGTVDNRGAITVRTQAGTADANGAADVSSSARGDAYGIKSDANVRNSAVVDVEGSGGTSSSHSGAGAAAVQSDIGADAYGIYAKGNVYNDGTIVATAHRGTGAAGTAEAYGIQAQGAVDNHNVVTALATGGGAQAFGISGARSDVNNVGHITASALAGTVASSYADVLEASARAYGINVQDVRVLTSGLITVNSGGGTVDANAAVDARSTADAESWGVHTGGPFENSGEMVVNAFGGTILAGTGSARANAWGVYAMDDFATNNGQITAAAAGGSLNLIAGDSNDVMDASAWVYGMGSFNGALENNGNITLIADGGSVVSSGGTAPHAALASAWAYGLVYSGGGNWFRHVNNTDQIMVTASGGNVQTSADQIEAAAHAYGIDSGGAPVDNSGAITVAAFGGGARSSATSTGGEQTVDASAWAYGINAAYAFVDNRGSITAGATGGTVYETDDAAPSARATAYGILGRGSGLENVEDGIRNAGGITVTAYGGTAPGDGASAAAYGAGLSANAMGIDNSGNVAVDVTALHGTAQAVGLFGATVDVNNSGTIMAAATAGAGFVSEAYGIQLAGDSTLTNTGIIRASADNAYEVCVAGGTTTLLHTYNVTLDGDPNRASILVNDGATLALNKARLTVAGVDGATQWDTPYRLFETEGTGVVQGGFGRAQALNPSVFVLYDDQNSAGAADDTVALTYDPPYSVALPAATIDKQLVAQAVDVVNRHMTSTMLWEVLAPPDAALLADAGPVSQSVALGQASSSQPRNGVFVEPYYSQMSRDADPLGYDAGLWGFSAGYERHLENTLLAAHMGYGRADIDYTGQGFDSDHENQDTLTGGISGLTRWDAWIVRYGAAAFYGWHDYQGLTGMLLEEQEEASYASYGLTATAMTGYVFRHREHAFVPEIGLTWLWAHRDRYTTEATDPSWNTTFSTLDDHDVHAEADLRWLSSFTLDDVWVSPMASVGVRYLLTDDSITVWQSIPGVAPVLVESEQDRTTITASGGLTLAKAHYGVSLVYDGEFGQDTQRNSFWLRLSWLF